MLYLAEIQKQSKGFMGGVETRLKLIACQRNDQSWSLVNNESIVVEAANDFGDGALVAVNLSTGRQLQGKIELASQKIIGVLKNFSRLLEKNQEQEQEINQWKESLAIQSEELSRRQIEMETRLEQVEQMEEEFKQFGQQKAEIEAARAETEKIRLEFEAKSTELEGAWEQLRGQQQSVDEQIKQARVIDHATATSIKQHLVVIAQVGNISDTLPEKLKPVNSVLEQQQEMLALQKQILEQTAANITPKEQELTTLTESLSEIRGQVKSLQQEITAAEQQLTVERNSLESKQELARFLNLQSDTQDKMLEMLSGTESDTDGATKVNLEELENMPLPNLESMVESLKKDLEKVAQFVSDQEEELSWQCKAVEELEVKISQVNDFERLTLEQELADEKEAKKMLDQTLVGQRRSLKERHQVLLQHSRVLKRRQGIIDLDFESELQDFDLTPIKQSLAEQQQKLQQQKQELTEEVAQIEESIDSIETSLAEQQEQKQQLESNITQQEQNYQELNLDILQMQFQVEFYQQQVKSMEDALANVDQGFDELRQLLDFGEKSPRGSVEEIEKIIDELTISQQ